MTRASGRRACRRDPARGERSGTQLDVVSAREAAHVAAWILENSAARERADLCRSRQRRRRRRRDAEEEARCAGQLGRAGVLDRTANTDGEGLARETQPGDTPSIVCGSNYRDAHCGKVASEPIKPLSHRTPGGDPHRRSVSRGSLAVEGRFKDHDGVVASIAPAMIAMGDYVVIIATIRKML